MEDLSKTPTTLSLQEWKKAAEELYAGNYPGVDDKVPFGKAKQYLGVPDFDGDLRTPTSAGGGKVNMKKAATRAEAKKRQAGKRSASAEQQTVGEDVYGKNIVTPKGSDLQEHHKRVISVYEPFFEGLNEKETKELAQWFVDEGFPLGNVKENLEGLTIPEHEDIHKWLKQNYIQSETGKPLMSFKGMSLNERLPAALMYLENVQPAVDEQLQSIISKRPGNSLAQTAVSSSILQKAQQIKPGFKKVAGALPVLGTGLTVMTAAGQAMAGDFAGAGGTLIDEAPGISDISGPALAGGTLEDRAAAEAKIAEAKQLRANAEAARQRGGKIKVLGMPTPEFGLSELMGIN